MKKFATSEAFFETQISLLQDLFILYLNFCVVIVFFVVIEILPPENINAFSINLGIAKVTIS